MILTNGAVPMSVLEILINELIDEVKAMPILFGGSFVTGNYIWQIFSPTSIFVFMVIYKEEQQSGYNFEFRSLTKSSAAGFDYR